MATKAPRPGRALFIFGLVVAALYGAVALGGQWTPKLGLDLQGGTRITLEASTSTGENITSEKLTEAAAIIDSRVNGSGVSEAEVATQGNRNIIVEIPGSNSRELVDTVKQTAQLRFRLVAGQPAPGSPVTPPASPSGSASPSSGAQKTPATGDPSANSPAAGDPSAKPSRGVSPSASPRGRVAPAALDNQGVPAAKPSRSPGTEPSARPSASASAGSAGSTTPSPGGASGQPSAAPTTPAVPPAGPTATTAGAPVDEPLEWMRNPGDKWIKAFSEFTCPVQGKKTPPIKDVPTQPLLTCDDQGLKYLLSAAMIEGTELSDASAGIPQQQTAWVVDLSFKSSARKTFADVTTSIEGTGEQFAIVLDGKVISAPVVTQAITGGNAQITGDFSQAEASSLANSLKYGALPLRFAVPVVTEEGPSLASDQLSAGLWAGAIGLLLVLVYCMLYYRGLGLVVFASLMVAAAVTYAAVLLMGQAVNFTLTLPGIAGLIVAVGITADSFIVYFERIRDEMRDGKSMRVAVEAGWVRARATCVAADTVSLLAAVVLYIFAIGVVKGFAFALGISTLIDLVVFFFFTKPLVSWLATFRFFNSGHNLSGLSAEHVGIDRIVGASRLGTAGRTAR